MFSISWLVSPVPMFLTACPKQSYLTAFPLFGLDSKIPEYCRPEVLLFHSIPRTFKGTIDTPKSQVSMQCWNIDMQCWHACSTLQVLLENYYQSLARVWVPCVLIFKWFGQMIPIFNRIFKFRVSSLLIVVWRLFVASLHLRFRKKPSEVIYWVIMHYDFVLKQLQETWIIVATDRGGNFQRCE